MAANENLTKTARRGRWLRGQSGNPKGAPPLPPGLIETARAKTEACIRILITIAENPESPANARVAACQALLDRGHGKSPERMEMVQAR